jgi:hypothetical protein
VLKHRTEPSGFSENALDHIDGDAINRGDLGDVIPYSTQVRMRANCDFGIVGRIRGSEPTGALLSS